jgi:O-antigen/teichoic acid export membrane protein
MLPFISRVMSPSEYGAASMLTAAPLILLAIMASPLEALVFRTVPRGGEEAPGLLRVTGIYCYVLLPLTAAIVATGFALIIPTFLGVAGSLWAIETLAIGFQPAMTAFALPVVKSSQDLPRFIWLAGSSVLFAAVSKLMLVVVWQLAVLGWVISDLIGALLSAILAMVVVRPPRTRVAWHDVRAVARFAVPLIPHHASYWAISSLSRPLLAMVSTLAQVGLLALGLNVASIVAIAVAEFNGAVQPRYSRETFPAPTRNTYPAVRWQVVLAMAAPAGVGAALALVGQWVFAEPYWPSFALTGVLLVAQAAYGVYPIAMNYLVLTAGLPKYSALATGTGTAILLGAIFIFGREYGAMGFAYATTAGYVAMAGVAVALTRLTKLDISWRAWARCWPEMTIGAAALTCSVAALACPVGSAISRILAGGCLILLLGVAILITRSRSPVAFLVNTAIGAKPREEG